MNLPWASDVGGWEQLDGLLDASGLDAAGADGDMQLAAILDGVHALQVGLKAAFVAITGETHLVTEDRRLAADLTHCHGKFTPFTGLNYRKFERDSQLAVKKLGFTSV